MLLQDMPFVEVKRNQIGVKLQAMRGQASCFSQLACLSRQLGLPSDGIERDLADWFCDVESDACALEALSAGEHDDLEKELDGLAGSVSQLQQRYDDLLQPMLQPLSRRCLPIVRVLNNWLKAKGIIPKTRNRKAGKKKRNDSTEDLNDSTEDPNNPKLLAHQVSHLLLAGRCCCGEDKDRLRELHRKKSACAAKHRFSDWNFAAESLNHFLLRALLGARYGAGWQPDAESNVQQAANHMLKKFTTRTLAGGMLLCWFEPQLAAVLLPVCGKCKGEVRLNNTCNCGSGAPAEAPSLVYRLVPKKSLVLEFRPYSMYRVHRGADGVCHHGGEDKTGKLVFPAVPVPAWLWEDGAAGASRPICPDCEKPLSRATRVDVRHRSMAEPHRGAAEDCVVSSLEGIVSVSLERPGDSEKVRAGLRWFREQAGRLLANRGSQTEQPEQELSRQLKEIAGELKRRCREAAEVMMRRMSDLQSDADEV